MANMFQVKAFSVVAQLINLVINMKNLLSTVRGWVVVGVILGSGGAWGQSNAAVFKSFNTDKGCELGMEVRGSANRNYTWSGECRDGKVWGSGVLTYETYDSYGKKWETRWAEAGQFDREGRQSANWMVVNRINKIIGFSPFQNGERKGIRFLSQASKPETLAGAKEYLNDWTGGRAETMVPFLLTAATAYFEDRANFYSGDFAKSSSTNNPNSNANSPQENSADDPKVFGRSARGG